MTALEIMDSGKACPVLSQTNYYNWKDNPEEFELTSNQTLVIRIGLTYEIDINEVHTLSIFPTPDSSPVLGSITLHGFKSCRIQIRQD
jgi:hypothetical protein